MSFSRIKIAESENDVVVSNACIDDTRLSLKAKGLFATIMSLPPTFDFSIDGIVAIVKEGETVVYSAMKELIDCGYVKRIYINEKGRRVGVEYVFNS